MIEASESQRRHQMNASQSSPDGAPAERIARFGPNPQVASRSVGSEVVLLNMEDGQYYSLNDTGALVWQLLQAHRPSLDDLAAEVIAHFEIDATTAHRDIEALVESLIEHGLVART